MRVYPIHLINLIPCSCRCGTLILSRDLWGDKRMYFKGHYLKGKKCSDISIRQLGHLNHNWKGGKKMDGRGYILIKKRNHHFATTNGYVKEHRLVWEQHNKASLLRWAAMHHKNHIRTDNRIENLEAMMRNKHTSMHRKGRCIKDPNTGRFMGFNKG